MLSRMRVWAVVVPLLAGLFAMHGPQPATGAMHMLPLPATAPSMPMPHATPPPASPAHAMGVPAAPVPATAGEAPASATPVRAYADGARTEAGPAVTDGHGAMMCLALLVLLAVALLMTRAPWLVMPRLGGRGRHPRRVRGRRAERGPPLFLRLCVFRL